MTRLLLKALPRQAHATGIGQLATMCRYVRWSFMVRVVSVLCWRYMVRVGIGLRQCQQAILA